MDLQLNYKIAKEIINEEKRKGKMYSYLNTIIGAGQKYKGIKSGGGAGWTNWVTVKDNYDKDINIRGLEIARIGVSKEEAVVPIPDIDDSSKLLLINKFFDKFTKIIMDINQEAENANKINSMIDKVINEYN